ncbi:MAG: phosphoglycerate kinase [Candidatus Marinimicrobia bacterium]|nr:phosphoglycerate kinase [Candidatus Neomarinimicrobiota bacterium]|tara:strand:+ start:5751 stop:6941 length:1191 start_codon:yes stop_codon:yes gene_type:complete
MIRSLNSFDLKDKRVLIRVDYNVPVENGVVKDAYRIQCSIPTIKECLEAGASVVLMSHLGRPNGSTNDNYSMISVGEVLSDFLEIPIKFSHDCINEDSINVTIGLHPGEVHLLENLRFHRGEEENDFEFSRLLSKHGQIFINDAFGTSHRSHASNVGVTDNFMHKGMGLLMEKEIQYLMHKFKKPKEPLVLLLGGAKISDKIDMIERFIIKAKSILIGGGMTFTFLKAMGLNVGKSMIDESMISTAKTIIKKARQNRVKIKLPVDFVVSDAIDKPSKIETVSFDSIPDNMIGLDIGPETIKLFSNIILQSGTVLWNGPMGVFEKKEFENGTKSIANLLSDMKDQNIDTIVGGGDSASAIRKFSDIENITHVSTGGGASLELLGGKSLPAITALEKL